LGKQHKETSGFSLELLFKIGKDFMAEANQFFSFRGCPKCPCVIPAQAGIQSFRVENADFIGFPLARE
jgi:hypothetical protein